MNLGTEENPEPTYLSKELTHEEREQYIALLIRNKDCFAWNYKQMPGLDPKKKVHRLGLPPDQEPYKQPPKEDAPGTLRPGLR